MRRRDFVAALGSAAAWPLMAGAQQPGRVRRIGVLMSTAADDGQGQVWSAAFVQGLQQLGWEVGGNIRIDYRRGAGDTDRFRKYAAELVAFV
jgi:putative ABC transport system substrate-binding protein